jgi:hypothetical protein
MTHTGRKINKFRRVEVQGSEVQGSKVQRFRGSGFNPAAVLTGGQINQKRNI